MEQLSIYKCLQGLSCFSGGVPSGRSGCHFVLSSPGPGPGPAGGAAAAGTPRPAPGVGARGGAGQGPPGPSIASGHR